MRSGSRQRPNEVIQGIWHCTMISDEFVEEPFVQDDRFIAAGGGR